MFAVYFADRSFDGTVVNYDATDSIERFDDASASWSDMVHATAPDDAHRPKCPTPNVMMANSGPVVQVVAVTGCRMRSFSMLPHMDTLNRVNCTANDVTRPLIDRWRPVCFLIF